MHSRYQRLQSEGTTHSKIAQMPQLRFPGEQEQQGKHH